MHKNSSIKYNIINGQFDFSDFFDTCDRYGRSKRLSVKEINMIQLMIEEVIVNHILKHASLIEFTIDCEKNSKDVHLDFTYDGAPYNLYTAEREDELSLVIIKCLTRKCIYKYREQNLLEIWMQLGVGEEAEIIEE